MKRISYVKLLVEVDTTKPLVRSIPRHIPKEGVRTKVLEYENEPKVCSSCHKLGHGSENRQASKRNRGQSRGRSRLRKGKNVNYDVASKEEVQGVDGG